MIVAKIKYPSFRKRVALFLTVIMVFETIFPTASFALTSGPSAPEFSSFEPVATTNMVNEFSGDFTYNIPVINIPGTDGGGYALSLSYHSGESLESEASWVGYGWTLNPGAINRSKRGFADDTKSSHTFHNDVPKNWTASVGTSVGDPELFSTDIPISLNAGLRYNNYKGFGYTAGAGLSIKGIVSLGYSVSDGNSSFSAQVNPGEFLHAMKNRKLNQDKKDALKNAKSRAEKKAIRKTAKNSEESAKGEKIGKAIGQSLSSYGMHTFGDLTMPTSITPYTGQSYNVSLNVTLDPAFFPVGISMGLNGNYTQQTNTPLVTRTGYGYLYSNLAYTDASSMMDYYTEKDSPFNKRDRYLSIPFSNADQYSLTGEGLSGGFRLHSQNVGLFRPNYMESKTLIAQAAVEVNLGLTMGVGLDIGVGQQKLTYFGDRWGETNSTFLVYNFPSSNSNKENYFMRFTNDLGGDVDFGSNGAKTALVVGKMPVLNSTPSGDGYNDQFSSLRSYISTNTSGTSVQRSGRSSYIGYNTYAERSATSNGKRINAFDNNASTHSYSPAISSEKDSQIAEITTVNEEGNTYVYGLASNSDNEKNMSYSVEGGTVQNRFIAYKNISGANKMKVGNETNGDYAATYMLTQINTPDYVDRKLDGATPDDFGGYTKFSYKKYQSNYHWRMPYTGLNYSKGNQSNQDDDMGSFTSGDKEIYYLDTIFTKTHLAIFYKSPRFDGVEAASDMAAASNSLAVGTYSLQKLDSICLFINNNGVVGKKIKKTCFQYDYSQCQNVPNNKSTTLGSKGKLTLKKVWFEYEGIVSAKISPYVFGYTYANPASYPFPYNNINNPNKLTTDYSAILTSTVNENPDYTFCNIDAWGNYQKNGAARYNDLKFNVNQKPDADFDPAAWQLKRITLPSGGEIHIQYEQDDYQYVQNRRAMALVNLLNSSEGTASTFTLDIQSTLGSHSDAEVNQLVELIKNEFSTNDKIYFKFLYTLIGGSPADLNSCNAEYITGYVNTASVTAVGVSGSRNIEIKIDNTGSYALPWNVCKDMVKKELGGKINPSGNCDPADGIDDGGSASAIVSQLVSKMGTIFTPNNLCGALNPQLSYFKIPILKAKKGGGIRVKRILMYDADGVDDGQAALYGSEYVYKLENGESSGVATNEPATIREENPLISFLPKRSDQTLLNKAISGTDKEQFEGPLGESILPAPSVGYSRVVSKNIHNGKTSTGFVVSDFYTAKDYPFDMNYASVGKGVDYTNLNDLTMDKFWLNVPAILVNISCNNYWAAQGYRFVKNNMHGQPKSVATYAGDFTPGTPNLANKSSATEYEYFAPDEKLPVLKDDGSTELKNIGKEMEVVMESRGVEDITVDGNLELDVDIALVLPIVIPFPTAMPSLNYSERKMYTHVTSKVVSFPAIQKSIIQTQDGISHKTENIAFSRFTGKPVRTKSYDGFNAQNLEQSSSHEGVYTTYEIPGFSEYKELGQKAINQNLVLPTNSTYSINLNYNSPNYQLNLVLPSLGNANELCNAIGALSIGDLIFVNGYYFHIDGFNGTTVKLIPSGHYNSATPTAANNVSVRVVKSGKTNQLNTMIGSYTTYGTTYTNTATLGNLAITQAFVNTLNSTISSLAEERTAVLYPSDEIGLCPKPKSITILKGVGSITITTDEPTCQGIYEYPGSFILDNATGQIKYVVTSMPCVQYDVPCLTICGRGQYNTTTNVIASSASTLNHIWPYDNALFDLNNLNTGKNDYETGKKGKWRTESMHAYKGPIMGGAIENGTTHERIYKSAGTYTMSLFNWKNPATNDSTKWVRTSTVTKYNPNGSAIEEKDAGHYYSTAKYGYNQTLPYLIAKNATYNSVAFESFENVYENQYFYQFYEDKLSTGASYNFSNFAHSGKKSYMLGTLGFTFANSVFTHQMQSAGVSCKVWVKDPQRAAMPIKGSLIGNVTLPITFSKIAQTGEWILYEAKITSWTGMTLGSSLNFFIMNNISSQPTVYIDDIRMQPLNAQVNTYVYDVISKRLLTSFDDQHFGLYYQYNQEGKLVRKLIETERGMKTIAETQYNTPKVSR